jgi:UDP-3-O-[3-hydroxymyristoyl] N-acetylglucosamine deacetylase
VQTTLKSSASFAGIGLHTGRPVRMTVRPASAEHGIWFRRVDLIGHGTGPDPMVPAHWSAVMPSRLCTMIENASGVSVSTIEHIMAALAGCGIHNALIDVDGPEVPILDGSAAPFVAGFLARGIRELDAELRCFEILQTVEVRDGNAVVRLEPAETLEIDFRIDFEDRAIGRQHKSMTLANGAFVRELSDSRTFCRQSDVDAMRANGLALGGTYENAVVVEGDRILTPGGLRHRDEAVRHKMLDAMGDLALAGAPILGRYSGVRAGHAMTNRLLRTLFARPDAFRIVECSSARARQLPGAGVVRGDLPAFA